MNNVIQFLEKHKNLYSEYFEKNRLSKCKYGYTCDINQIYCFLGEKNIEESEYYNFYNISKKYFNLKQLKILDVCCGKIPILASIYNDKCINIEAIDKKILIKNYKNIKTYEKNILSFNKINEFDLIIAFRPCNPTEIIINKCIEYKKNFIIYLCPCIHQGMDSKKEFKTYNDWIKYLKQKLFSQKDYQIKFINSTKMPDKCPIIIGKIKV